MLVKDTVKKTELELTTAELIDLVANGNRQVDLVFDEKQSDEDGYLHWDRENWTSVDGKRFIRSYFLDGRALSDYSGYNKYDMKGYFQPERPRKSCLVKRKRAARRRARRFSKKSCFQT